MSALAAIAAFVAGWFVGRSGERLAGRERDVIRRLGNARDGIRAWNAARSPETKP